MRIAGWECIVDETGKSRGASHPLRGSMVWLNGRLIGHGDVPTEVVLWLIRPDLRSAWAAGNLIGYNQATCDVGPREHAEWSLYNQQNPYNGEPPNKDRDPS